MSLHNYKFIFSYPTDTNNIDLIFIFLTHDAIELFIKFYAWRLPNMVQTVSDRKHIIQSGTRKYEDSSNP